MGRTAAADSTDPQKGADRCPKQNVLPKRNTCLPGKKMKIVGKVWRSQTPSHFSEDFLTIPYVYSEKDNVYIYIYVCVFPLAQQSCCQLRVAKVNFAIYIYIYI